MAVQSFHIGYLCHFQTPLQYDQPGLFSQTNGTNQILDMTKKGHVDAAGIGSQESLYVSHNQEYGLVTLCSCNKEGLSGT